MQAELQGGRTALRNLGSKQHRLDEEHLKQQEILYTQVGMTMYRGVHATHSGLSPDLFSMVLRCTILSSPLA